MSSCARIRRDFHDVLKLTTLLYMHESLAPGYRDPPETSNVKPAYKGHQSVSVKGDAVYRTRFLEWLN